MALGPTPQQGYTPPPLQGGSPPVYTPPRRIVFASNISNTIGARTLSRAEIDQAIRQHGTNIAVMVDVGGTTDMRSQAGQMLEYIRQKGVKHIGVYTEGPTGPTGSKYEAGEFARKEAGKRKYGMTESQWMNGGWEKSFHDQVRHFAKHAGATFFEADNIPSGQTVRFLKSFQAAKNRGELPPHVQMLMKNPTHGEINELRTALANGSVKRETIADFAISEEFMRSSWPSLKKGLAEFGIQLGYSHDTHNYACKEEYDQGLLGALGKFLKDAVHGVAEVISAPFKLLGAALGVEPAKPEPPRAKQYGVPHPVNHPPAHYTQTQVPRPAAPALHPVQGREPVAPQWRFNTGPELKPDGTRQDHPSPRVWQFKMDADEPAPPRQRPA